MRHTDHRRLGDFRVRDHRAFDLGSPHAVAGNVEHVVHATGDPVVTVFVATRTVTGEVHATERLEVGVDEAVVVAVQRARLTRPGIENHQIAFGRALDQVAQVVHQRRNHAEERTCCRTRFERGRTRQRADQDAAGFGLPPGVDDRAVFLAHGVVVPAPGFRVDRLADRTQQTQAGTVSAFNRTRALGHHGANGGRCGVEDVDLVLVDDFRHAGDVRVVRHAFEQQRGRAVGQRAVDDVAVAGDPAHVCRAPVDLARLVVEHAFVSQCRVEQITGGGVQHALGLAGGTGGVKDEQGFFSAHFLRRAGARCHFQQCVVPDVAMAIPLDLAAGALADNDFLDAAGFRVGQRTVDIGLERGFLAATQTFVSSDDDLGTAIDDAAGQRFR